MEQEQKVDDLDEKMKAVLKKCQTGISEKEKEIKKQKEELTKMKEDFNRKKIAHQRFMGTYRPPKKKATPKPEEQKDEYVNEEPEEPAQETASEN